ncbi:MULTISPECIES: hypothetical protein [Brevibacillus]|uniref:hypothetical protein n=1 Tax=Brevibacillus TaxID=55080 RepID=UPI00363F1C17
MKKVVASLLSLSLVLSASISALAAEPAKTVNASQKTASTNDPYEPNDDPAFAPYINSNVTYNGVISHNKDFDWFNFYAKPGEFNFALSKLSSPPGEFNIMVIKQGGGIVHTYWSKPGNVNFTFNIPEEGSYSININSAKKFESTPIAPAPYAFKAIFNQ